MWCPETTSSDSLPKQVVKESYKNRSELTMNTDIILYEKLDIKSKARHFYVPPRGIPVTIIGILQMSLGLVSS